MANSKDQDISVYLYNSGGLSQKAVINNATGVRNGYYGQSVAAVAGPSNLVYINTAKTKQAYGWEMYVNDESTSYQIGDIVTFAGATYTVGLIQKPPLNVKKAKFYNTTEISGTPLGGITMGNTRTSATFNISINLT